MDGYFRSTNIVSLGLNDKMQACYAQGYRQLDQMTKSKILDNNSATNGKESRTN